MKVENYRVRNNKLEQDLRKAKQAVSKAKERMNAKSSYFKELLARLKEELENHRKYFAKLKSEYETIPSKMAKEIEKIRLEKTDEASVRVKQKINSLFSVHELIESKNNEMNEATRLYQHCRANLRENYNEQSRRARELSLQSVSRLIEEYEGDLNARREELKALMQQTKASCLEDKMNARQYRNEVALLTSIMRKREKLMIDMEHRRHAKGMLSATAHKSRKTSVLTRPSFYHNNRSVSTSMTKPRGNRISRPNTSFQYVYCIHQYAPLKFNCPLSAHFVLYLSLIHICRCRRYAVCRSRWSPYH
eukprot:TRINITY_DN2400_c0_g2_i1.p1 TRINITY_DN2400_c0_g2~~TRINITY_DN2400_c0_g2_i1.p1  ORF type:complete len:306 (+),score=49.05 TRINITY_DN2400_c0_g2_i1:1179-2096(+)